MMVDASALLAILLVEPDGEELAGRLASARDPFTSPLAIYEATTRLMNARNVSASHAESEVRALIAEAGARIVNVSDATTSIALTAFERYGKGRHPAGLNFGDCFAYACARAHNSPLLYKGDDFAKTDLA